MDIYIYEYLRFTNYPYNFPINAHVRLLVGWFDVYVGLSK